MSTQTTQNNPFGFPSVDDIKKKRRERKEPSQKDLEVAGAWLKGILDRVSEGSQNEIRFTESEGVIVYKGKAKDSSFTRAFIRAWPTLEKQLEALGYECLCEDNLPVGCGDVGFRSYTIELW